MQISSSRRGRRLVSFACAVAALAASPSAANAQTTVSDLRVEAGGQVLTDASFVTGTETVTTDRTTPACGGSGQTKTLAGATALGLLASAIDRRPRLRPLRITDRFGFGLLVCGVGPFTSGTSSGFWLYKVNHVAPEVGGDAFKLADGEQVLWYFQDAANGRNTGAELAVEAPARARPGEVVQVVVSAYGFNGARRPAAGARVFFNGVPVVADAAGRALARTSGSGSVSVRAGRGSDIPSPSVRICVAARLAACPAARGKRIFGSATADRLAGTAGADVIRSGGGSDRIDVRGGSRDRVRCGSGRRDRVRLSRGDRVTRDCEILNGRRRTRAGG